MTKHKMKGQNVKLYHDGWRGKRPTTVAEAVETTIEGYQDHGSGALEQVSDKVQTTSRLVGRLVETLHTKGLLKDEDIIELVGISFVWGDDE